ncbi:quinate 5-dehydrogenase, partial [bacterium]
MKHVVSISLGTSKRDKRSEVSLLGEDFLLERIGTDGDMKRYADMFKELDGKVDAIGVGGADIAVVIGERRYEFKEIADIAKGAKITPVVDGGGLKHTLERATIETLQREGTVDFAHTRTLLVSAVDRFGMAQALSDIGGEVVYGDLLFGLGLPFAIRDYKWVKRLGAAILPLVTRLPFKW